MTGTKSSALKFRPMICRKCNGDRSQRFDHAYDQFMAFLSAHEGEIRAAESVDLRDVFGESWEADALDLVRYFVKHIGCRLAEVSDRRVIWLDTRLHDCLDGGGFPGCLQLDLMLDVGVLEFLRLVSQLPDEAGAAPHGTFLHLTGIWGAEDDRAKPLAEPQAGITVGGFSVFWRIADDGFVPNPFAGPIVSLPATDWMFPVEQRAAFSRISDAIELGNVDPVNRTMEDLVAEFI